MSDDTLAEQRGPGWYHDDNGVTRWWSGRDWTEHTQPAQPAPQSGKPARAPIVNQVAPAGPPKHPLADDPGTIWSALGRPLSGIGGGKFRLTAEMLYFERGTFSTNAQQIQTWQIHDVDATQTMTQKARGVGTITLHARRSGGDEVVRLEDVPDFREGVRLINDTAYEAGERKRLKAQTQHVNYQGYPPGVVQPVVPAATSPAPDMMGELTKLAALKEQGLLTDEEFTAAKKRLLGL